MGQGKLVAERYREGLGIGAASRLVSWSLAKSISTALLGLRVADGALRVTDIAQSPVWSPEEAASRNITSACARSLRLSVWSCCGLSVHTGNTG